MTFVFSVSVPGERRKIICGGEHKAHKDNPFDRNCLRLEPHLSPDQSLAEYEGIQRPGKDITDLVLGVDRPAILY